jgi:hypothetical protein
MESIMSSRNYHSTQNIISNGVLIDGGNYHPISYKNPIKEVNYKEKEKSKNEQNKDKENNKVMIRVGNS